MLSKNILKKIKNAFLKRTLKGKCSANVKGGREKGQLIQKVINQAHR